VHERAQLRHSLHANLTCIIQVYYKITCKRIISMSYCRLNTHDILLN